MQKKITVILNLNIQRTVLIALLYSIYFILPHVFIDLKKKFYKYCSCKTDLLKFLCSHSVEFHKKNSTYSFGVLYIKLTSLMHIKGDTAFFSTFTSNIFFVKHNIYSTLHLVSYRKNDRKNNHLEYNSCRYLALHFITEIDFETYT